MYVSMSTTSLPNGANLGWACGSWVSYKQTKKNLLNTKVIDEIII